MSPSEPKLPARPRNWDDVCVRLEALEQRVKILAEGSLSLSDHIGKLAAEMTRKLRDDERITRTSYYDFEQELDAMRGVLVDRVRDPRDRMTSERARAIAHEAVETAQMSGKAAMYDAWRKTGIRIVVGVVIGVAVAMTAAHFGVHP